VAYHFGAGSKSPAGPAKIAQISHWDKPMDRARLSPDGRAVAFSSPVAGVEQVFLMLASGGEALQLTNDETDKSVTNFSSDGTEIYYRRQFGRDETWSVPTLGGTSKRVVSGYAVAPSPDGSSIYYTKQATRTIFRAERTGMGEESLFALNPNAWGIARIIPFPDGNRLLVLMSSPISTNEGFQGYVVDLEKKSATEFVEMTQAPPQEVVWQEPGKSILFSRALNGLTNIWKMNLADKSLTQVTFGPGPDHSPMPEPTGKGLYLVNGKSTGYLTAYNTHTKELVDIAGENATQPTISRSGKKLMYVTFPSQDRNELWVSDVDGSNKTRLAQGISIATGFWSPDDSRLAFTEEPGKETKLYLVHPDGSGLQALKWMNATEVQAIQWSPDQKSVFINGWAKGAKTGSIWRESVEGLVPEKLTDDCGFAFDVSPDGKYLLTLIAGGDKIGIYAFSLADRSCTPLVPGVVTFGLNIEKDGKSFLYALTGKKDVTIYRQKWQEGKAVGQPQVALKLPFSFPLVSGGNAYDFSRDLATVVYARPSGHADLYLLTQQ
jgi:Tol biopolymer transport system component